MKRTRLGLEDFESLKVIGRGAFGEVKTLGLIVNDSLRFGVCSFNDLQENEELTGARQTSQFCLVVMPAAGPFGAEEGHGSRLRHENTPENRHAGEGAGQAD